MIPISYGTYDVSSKNFLPLLELWFKFIDLHTKKILIHNIPRTIFPSGRGSNKEMFLNSFLTNKRIVVWVKTFNLVKA